MIKNLYLNIKTKVHLNFYLGRYNSQKKQLEIKKLKLGRPGNTLKMGIVGLPNVGKSTTFNLLSKLNVPAENYPFCTIDPNLAVVTVPDQRFNYLVDFFKPKSRV
jgi:obg-like ATPase 1